MKTRSSILGLILVAGVLGCGGDPEPGISCASSDECGTLTCFCPVEGVPGTCSEECTDDADCAGFGSGYTCVEFGAEGVCGPHMICLRAN